MNKTYVILMREVNINTGEIAVQICEEGDQEYIAQRYNYLKLRSIFNPELSFYIALSENRKEAMREIDKMIVADSNLYVKI